MQQPIRHFTAFAAAIIAVHLLVAPNVALSADTPRVVNVTSDSEKGWLPSEALERQARKTAVDYLADTDSGKYAEAYAFLADIDQKDQPFPAFSNSLRKFNKRAGPSVERRIVTVTWTKNPAQAPLPGIYVSLDLVSRFANIDRHCGYLVLYQAPSGGDFRLMREESNFMDNATAANISEEKTAQAWASAYSHCPGYKPPLPEAKDSTIGYSTVEAALAALHAKPGVTFREEKGWTVAEDSKNFAIWSFPPKSHPAYPSAVKRWFVTGPEGTSLQMSVHCQASKDVCDDLVRTFQQLNEQMSQRTRQ
jgi:hypothetical protein